MTDRSAEEDERLQGHVFKGACGGPFDPAVHADADARPCTRPPVTLTS